MRTTKSLLTVLMLIGISVVTASAQRRIPAEITEPGQSPKRVRDYRTASDHRCYYLNSARKRIYVMKKLCQTTAPSAISDPAPAHKVLPGTVEIETSNPNAAPVNPVEPAEVTPERNRGKSKKTVLPPKPDQKSND